VIQAQHFRNITYKGRGEGVMKPAVSSSISISDRRIIQQKEQMINI
jgi:hypothetical protein